MPYRYKIEFKLKAKHQKEFQSGIICLKTLKDVADFVERSKKKYELCEFSKYDKGVLVSVF